MSEDFAKALAEIPAGMFWLMAKGRLTAEEPMYAIQLLEPDTHEILAQTEDNDPVKCIRSALALAAALNPAPTPAAHGTEPCEPETVQPKDQP